MALATSRQQRNAFAALGATAVLALGAVLAWRWTGQLDGGGSLAEVAMDASTPEPVFIPETKPTLVDVLDIPEASERTSAATRVKASSTPRSKSERPSSKKKRTKKEKSKSKRKAGADEVMITGPNRQIRFTPIIDAYKVPDINLGVPMTLSARAMAGDVGKTHSKSGLIHDAPTLAFPYGRAQNPMDRGHLVVDHPGALPVTLDPRRIRWSSDGSDLVAAPTVRLQPIGLRVALGGILIKKGRGQSGRAKGAVTPFHGTASLVAIDRRGDLEVLDSMGIGFGTSKKDGLRYGTNAGSLYVLGIPEAPSMAADLIEITREVAAQKMDGSTLQLPTGLRGRRPTRLKFEVLDPFSQPLKDAEVRAVVDPDMIGLRDRRGSPIRFGQFLFVKQPGDASGQEVSGGKALRLGLGLARETVVGATAENGQVVLQGVHPQVCLFKVKSPFGDEAFVEFPVTDTEAPQLTVAPLAAIEVHCPAIWREDDAGREAWSRAKVKLSGRSKMLPFLKADKNARGPRRYLVPAKSMVTITCEAKGTPKMSAEIRGPGQRGLTTHFPKPDE
jgi:hypothetical protein